MSRGKLKQFNVKPSVSPVKNEDNWKVEVTLINEDGTPRTYEGVTDSPAVLLVLATALYKPQYVFTIELSDDRPSRILEVNLDDRRSYCSDGVIANCPADTPVNAVTPTATVDDKGPLWSFYFSVGTKCVECSGHSLDVYAIIAKAWRSDKKVRLQISDGFIVGAKEEP
ncbi:hypothetical protein [Mesorhizobium sophorae]|uniref:hypothetical protein n=1 Tax=Mesorhizobium sophorae TaxID=1300294 RepID=UPI0011812088|nr:hypothetical protein [Mesorhizobium sophorae]